MQYIGLFVVLLECSGELIQCCSCHENVDGEEAPIFWYDNKRISGPDQACGTESSWLANAELISGPGKVTNASNYKALYKQTTHEIQYYFNNFLMIMF